MASEFKCRLRDPDKFTRFSSTDGTIDGKRVRNIIGHTRNDESMRQSIRFDKDDWDAGEARRACTERNGKFDEESTRDDAE